MVQPAQNEAVERLKCNWCQGINLKTALSCQFCGAPLDLKDVVSESGWREAPRLKDMTEFHFFNSTCQVEGEIVPVAEINLAQGDGIYFEHHVMLWKDPTVPMSVLQLPGGMKRVLAGMPFIISMAQGPGRVAFSAMPPANWSCFRFIPEWNWMCANMPFFWRQQISLIPLNASRGYEIFCSADKACTWIAS